MCERKIGREMSERGNREVASERYREGKDRRAGRGWRGERVWVSVCVGGHGVARTICE